VDAQSLGPTLTRVTADSGLTRTRDQASRWPGDARAASSRSTTVDISTAPRPQRIALAQNSLFFSVQEQEQRGNIWKATFKED
jgi:hypothetical protein